MITYRILLLAFWLLAWSLTDLQAQEDSITLALRARVMAQKALHLSTSQPIHGLKLADLAYRTFPSVYTRAALTQVYMQTGLHWVIPLNSYVYPLIRFSPDGRYVFAAMHLVPGNHRPQGMIFDLERVAPPFSIAKIDSPYIRFSQAIFTPDGKHLICADLFRAFVYDLSSQKIVKVIWPPRGYIKALALSKDGQTLWMGLPVEGKRNWIVGIDLATGRTIQEFSLPRTKNSSRVFLNISPDDQWIVTKRGGRRGRFGVWSTASGRRKRKFPYRGIYTKDRIKEARFAPNSKHVLLIRGNEAHFEGFRSAYPDGEVILSRTQADMSAGKFADDGSHLILEHMDGTLMLHHIDSINLPPPSYLSKPSKRAQSENSFLHHEPIRSFRGDYDRWNLHFDVSAHGKWIAGFCEGLPTIWRAYANIPRPLVSTRFMSAVSPDGRLLVYGHSRLGYTVETLSTGRQVPLTQLPAFSRLTTSNRLDHIPAFSPKGRYLFTMLKSRPGWPTFGVAESQTGRVVLTDTTGSYHSVHFSMDERWMTYHYVQDGNHTKLYDLSEGQLVRAHKGSLCFSHTAQHLLSFQPDKGLMLEQITWSAEKAPHFDTLWVKSESEYGLTPIGFDPTGTSVFTTDLKGTVYRWETKSGTLLQTFSGNGKGMLSVEVSPDGTYAIIGASYQSVKSARNVKLWNLTTATSRRAAATYADKHFFLEGGKYVVQGGNEGVIYLKESASGRLVRCLAAGIRNIGVIRLSPDQRQLLTMSDRGLYLWDLYDTNGQLATSGPPLQFFERTSNLFDYDAHFEPDGRSVLVRWNDQFGEGPGEARWELGDPQEISARVRHMIPPLTDFDRYRYNIDD
jgi:WD40 repeat protein